MWVPSTCPIEATSQKLLHYTTLDLSATHETYYKMLLMLAMAVVVIVVGLLVMKP